jgi:hypothetical protein
MNQTPKDLSLQNKAKKAAESPLKKAVNDIKQKENIFTL